MANETDEFIIWIKNKDKKNLEELANPCPLLMSETAPCKYFEETCYKPNNEYHKCTYYRRHVRQILFEEMRESERIKKKSETSEHHPICEDYFFEDLKKEGEDAK